MADLIKEKQVSITDRDGVEHAYIISRLPATVGREVMAKYPVSNMPRVGDYEVSEAIMVKLMSYVAAVASTGGQIRLQTKALIDNHVPDAQALARLEAGMIEYNFDFFDKGKASAFLKKFAPMLKQLITSTLMDLSAASSRAGKQPSKS